MTRHALALCAALLTGASASGADAGLRYVPANAAGVVHLRVSEMWKSPGMADVRDLVKAAGPEALAILEKRFSPSPADLESVTAFVMMPPGAREPMPFAILAFNKEVKKLDLESEDIAARKLDGSTILLAPPPRLRMLPANPAKEGPLAAALASAKEHHLTIAVNLAALPPMPIDDFEEPFGAIFESLLKTRLVTVTADFGEKLVLKATAGYENDEAATRAEEAIQIGVLTAKQFMGQGKDEMMKLLRGNPEEYPSPLAEMPEAMLAVYGMGAMKYVEQILDDLPLKRDGKELALTLTVEGASYRSVTTTYAMALGMMLPAVQKVRAAAARMKSQNNMKQIALALHNYHDVNGHFPPAVIKDRNGKALYSWRVAILPYIEQQNLYDQFKRDEPWDSEHNKQLSKLAIQTFADPSGVIGDPALTPYRVAVGNVAPKKGMNWETMFRLDDRRRFTNVTDGTSNTFMVFETSDAVPWAKPDPFVCEPGKPLPKIGGLFDGGGNVAFGDGSVQFIRDTVPEKTLRLYFGANDGQVIPYDE